jgi:hypothetical protein
VHSLHFEEVNLRRDRVANAESGTNDWIFFHPAYLRWQQEDSGILWIQGKPGSGKSVLAKSLLKHMYTQIGTKQLSKRNDTPVIADWFYSRRDGAVTMAHHSMIRSILYQIVKERRSVFCQFTETYRQRPPCGVGQSCDWTLEELEEMLNKTVVSGVEIICILDGLDESENNEQRGKTRQTIFAALLKLVSDLPDSRLKFIILSRPTTDIERVFAQQAKCASHDTGEHKRCHKIILQEENLKDIETIVDNGLRSLQEALHSFSWSNDESDDPGTLASIFSTMQRHEDEGLEEIRAYLLHNTKGVILWVTLVIKALESHCRCGGVTTTELKRKLKSLPADLVELYQYIVKDLERKLPKETLEKSRKILMWVSGASSMHSLSLQELWDALAIPEDVEMALQCKTDYRITYGVPIKNWNSFRAILYEWCGPFVEVIIPESKRSSDRRKSDEREQIEATYVIQLLHQTVKDFFADNKVSSTLCFREDEAIAMVKCSTTKYISIVFNRFLKEHATTLRQQNSTLESGAEAVASYLNDKCLLGFSLTAFGFQSHDQLDDLFGAFFNISPVWYALLYTIKYSRHRKRKASNATYPRVGLSSLIYLEIC